MADGEATDTEADVEGRPLCPRGAACQQTGLLHFADFAHPNDSSIATTTTTAGDGVQIEASSAEGSDTEVTVRQVSLKRQDTVPIEEFLAVKRRRTKVVEEEGAESGDGADPADTGNGEVNGAEDNGTPLTRGLSLVRQFSGMSHSERKALLAEALAARRSLERRLLRAESRERRYEEERTINGGAGGSALPLLPEEAAALRDGKFRLLPLTAEAATVYRRDSPEEIHYRVAEAQFHRLLARDCVGCFQVTRVEYVVNPRLQAEFRQFQRRLMSTEGLAEADWLPVLAFHGTDEAKIEAICREGFWTPGTSAEYAPASDTGWYGRGVYFSEFPACAMDYVKGRTRLLLCMVLPGRCHRCSGLHHGQPAIAGHHSHRSPDGRELVAFNSGQALPSYVVHYERSTPAPSPPGAQLSSPHDALHALYFSAVGLMSGLLAGQRVRVDPSGKPPGLLLTPDQVARFCRAQGADDVAIGAGGATTSDESDVIVVTLQTVDGGEAGLCDSPAAKVWTVETLLRRALMLAAESQPESNSGPT